jgi:hypothetical protein
MKRCFYSLILLRAMVNGYGQAGTPDPGFGAGGVVITPLTGARFKPKD